MIFSWCLFYPTVNRRLDEWVKLEQLDLNTVETDVNEKVEDKVIYVSISLFWCFSLSFTSKLIVIHGRNFLSLNQFLHFFIVLDVKVVTFVNFR